MEVPRSYDLWKGNHAVRSQDWRYIRYQDGTEELYRYPDDPHEWHNLSGKKNYRAGMDAHRLWLPIKEANPVPDMRR